MESKRILSGLGWRAAWWVSLLLMMGAVIYTLAQILSALTSGTVTP